MATQAFGRAAAVKAVLWTTGSTYISYFLGLVVSVLIARSLGAADYGRYAYLVWLSGVLVLIANYGLGMSAIKFVSECLGRGQRAHAAHAHAWLGRMQLAGIVLVALAYLAASPWLKPAGWEGRVWLLAGIVVVSFGFKAQSLFNTSIAKGFGRFSIEPVTNVAVTLLSALTVVALALLHAGVLAYALAFAGASIAYAAISSFQLRRADLRARVAADAGELVARMRPHLFWTVVLAAVTAIGNRSVEMFLLNHWVGAAEVGYFAIAAALTRAGIDLLAAGLSSVMMPVMGYVFGTGDTARAQRLFGDACRYYQFFGLLIAGVGVCWAEAIVALMYGAQYLEVVPVFRIMVVTSGVLLANGAFSAVLANSDNQRFRVGVTVVSFAVTFAVAFALIPRYGVIGAALAQAVAAVLCAFIVVAGIRHYTGLHLPWGALLRQYLLAGVVAAAAFGIVLAGGGGHAAQWAAGIFFALALVAFSPAAGLWRDDERAFAAEQLGRRRALEWLAAWVAPRTGRGA